MRKRHKHSLSHYRLFSCDMGELVPIGVIPVLPGDTFQHAVTALVRVQPQIAPLMHPVHVRIHHWYVPYRLIWNEWEDFITGGPAGISAPTFPTINLTYGVGPPATGNNQLGFLPDYLGVPPGINNLEVSALPFRAYATIWNEFYRDQDLQTELVVSLNSGADVTTNTALQNVAWEKDYFTSARPFSQKGPAVTVPISGTATVSGLGFTAGATPGGASGNVIDSSGATVNYNPSVATSAAGGLFARLSGSAPNARADINVSGSTFSFTIADLRRAAAFQRYEEMRGIFGSRYSEYLRQLGVRSSDARLQRPEYLGGGKQTIQFSEVLQTAPAAGSVVGDLAGHGIAGVRSNRYRRFFEEHGVVLSLMSVRPRTMYVQGLPREWNKRTKLEFWTPEMENIGQQPIQNREIYNPSAAPTGTFGWQDRYDEYRRMESNIAGDMRSTLDFWHMARVFAAEPVLNASFVSSVPTKRNFAVPGEDVLWVMANHHLRARRLVAARGGKSFVR